MQFLSNILAEARGSLNGTVFSRNRAGAYTRGRTTPINPNTPGQSFVRANFAAVANAWALLTSSEAADWNVFAATQTRTNKLGQPYTPNGRQLFMEFNTNLAAADLSFVTVPPVNPVSPAYLADDFVFAIGSTAGVIDEFQYAGPTPVGSDVFLIQASAAMSPGRLATSVPYKQIDVVSSNSEDLLPEYTAKFGTAGNAGDVVHIRYRPVDGSTGVGSSWTYVTKTIVASP